MTSGQLDLLAMTLYCHYMGELENFDRLVSSLDLEERQELLEKLKGQSTISYEPLYVDDIDLTPSKGSLEDEYIRLSWYMRFWYAFLGFFKSKPAVEIFADSQVTKLDERVGGKAPGVYDYQRRMLLSGFFRQIVSLKEGARYFYSALDTSVNRDRGAFYNFLASLEMPNVHSYLHTETNPKTIYRANPNISDSDLRSTALAEMETAFAMITDTHRGTMYYNARSLFCLKQLSSFLFDRIILAFNNRASEHGETCSINLVRELLLTLNDILFSLKEVPPMTLLESLFVFVIQDKTGTQGFDMNSEISSHLAKAEAAISVIRNFNRQIPLTWILRCASRNMSIMPREMSGGEDWMMIYRDYWKRRIEFLCSEHIKERQEKELLRAFQFFLKGRELIHLKHVNSGNNPDGLPIKDAFALSFLLSFHSEIFMPEINDPLYSILTGPEIQDKESRTEYSLAYDTLEKLGERIRKFEGDISPDGDYGSRYAQARKEMSSIHVKRRKIQIILDETSEDSETIIGQVKEASRGMIKTLGALTAENTAMEDMVNMFKGLLDLLDGIPAAEENDLFVARV